MPGLGAYTVIKAGAFGLTKVDALDYRPEGIGVNSVGPGNTITPMLQSAMGSEQADHYAAATSLRRLGQPEDITNGLVFLSSIRAQYITGITLPIDGGLNSSTIPP